MTKQFGNLKLHFSKRGIAYKWGDGEIHRLSFGQKQQESTDAYAQASGGYDGYGQTGYEPDGQSPYGYDQGYGPDYGGNQGYDAEQSGDYEDRPNPNSGSYELLYHTDWVMWAALVLLPPLGIWILWKRERFDTVIRAAISAASAIWFIVLLVWLFTSIFSGGSDPTKSNVQLGGTLPPATTPAAGTVAPDTLPTVDPNAGLDLTTTTPANPSGFTGTQGGTTGTPSTNDSDTVYATSTGSYYHKTQTCSEIPSGSIASPITLAVAIAQKKTACQVCYAGAAGSGTPTNAAKYWATRTGKYYHKVKTCGGMKNAKAYTSDQAAKEGKSVCPVCIGNKWMTTNGKYIHLKRTCSGMTNAKRVTNKQAKDSGKPKCPVCYKTKTTTKTGVTYYASAGGTYYHTKSTCTGMKNAARVTTAQIASRKLKACPTCVSTKTTSSKTYYATTVGKYYHVKSNCSGMKGAAKVTLTTAKKRGQTACPVCIPKTASSTKTTYYATEVGKYYHKTATCSGMKGAKKITLATAKSKGKTACPTCLPSIKTGNTYVYTNANGKYYHSKNNCQGMKNAKKVSLASAKKDGKKACPTCMKTVYYYSTASNRYYHKKSDCSGMSNATKLTLVSAKAKGKIACPVCVTGKAKPADMKTYCYTVSGGRYYHKNKTCSGMKKASKVTLAYAKAKGKTACPTCFKKTTSSASTQAADKKVTCYLTKSGTYYHTSRGCEKLKGKKNITKTNVANAKKNNKAPCPDCVSTKMRTYVYAIPTGLLYHRTPTCSGMKSPMKLTLDTALKRAYKRCTKCNAPASK